MQHIAQMIDAAFAYSDSDEDILRHIPEKWRADCLRFLVSGFIPDSLGKAGMPPVGIKRDREKATMLLNRLRLAVDRERQRVTLELWGLPAKPMDAHGVLEAAQEFADRMWPAVSVDMGDMLAGLTLDAQSPTFERPIEDRLRNGYIGLPFSENLQRERDDKLEAAAEIERLMAELAAVRAPQTGFEAEEAGVALGKSQTTQRNGYTVTRTLDETIQTIVIMDVPPGEGRNCTVRVGSAFKIESRQGTNIVSVDVCNGFAGIIAVAEDAPAKQPLPASMAAALDQRQAKPLTGKPTAPAPEPPPRHVNGGVWHEPQEGGRDPDWARRLK